ncbi:MAG TPA: hypothetical protein VIL23_01490 [Clostridia bacterium]
MGYLQDFNDFETADITCPKCGSCNITRSSFNDNDDMYLCNDCGSLFGSSIQKDDDHNY